MILRYLLKYLVLPPASNLIGLLLAWAAWRRYPRLARGMAVLSLASLWLLATPQVAQWLAVSLQAYPAIESEALDGQRIEAIVVLGGGRYWKAPEYGGEDTVSTRALMRLRYAAKLARASDLPVLASGGSVYGGREAEAALMAKVLRADFGITKVWQEGLSKTTRENAFYSAKLLASKGIGRVALVSESLHLRRAVPAFERQGLLVLPAPTGLFAGSGQDSLWLSWTPSAKALMLSSDVLHEWLGIAVYGLLNVASSLKSSI